MTNVLKHNAKGGTNDKQKFSQTNKRTNNGEEEE